jgi:hypothetical protein
MNDDSGDYYGQAHISQAGGRRRNYDTRADMERTGANRHWQQTERSFHGH